MAGKKRKKKVELVAVPLEVVPPEAEAPAPEPPPAPAPPPADPPPQLDEGLPGAKLRNEKRRIAVPQPVMPMNPDDVLNNVLCREIVDPQDTADKPSDPNIAILDEIANGLAHGTSVNHVKDDIIRIASHQAEKTEVVKTVLRAIDLTRVNRFVQVRNTAEEALSRAVNRGDLKSTEYLAFLRYSQAELEKIKEELSDQSGSMNSFDTQAVIEKVDHARQKIDQQQAEERLKGTTPQGREIVRKHLFQVQKALKKAGKMKEQPNGGVHAK